MKSVVKFPFTSKKAEDLPEQGRSGRPILIVSLPLQMIFMPGKDSLRKFTKAGYCMQFSISIPHIIIMGRMAQFSIHLILFYAKQVDDLCRYKVTPVYQISMKQNTSKVLLKLRGMNVLGRTLGWSSSRFFSLMLLLVHMNIGL